MKKILYRVIGFLFLTMKLITSYYITPIWLSVLSYTWINIVCPDINMFFALAFAAGISFVGSYISKKIWKDVDAPTIKEIFGRIDSDF